MPIARRFACGRISPRLASIWGWSGFSPGICRAAWADYEWRLRAACGHLQPRMFSQARWRGEALDGRTILLHAEQGLGDTIQFCRYAPLVALRGGCVVLEVPRPLLRLLSSLAGVTRLIAAGDPLPDFAVHCSLMSLPLAFGTDIDTIPAEVPYLSARPETACAWQDRLGPKTRRRVGLVWSGGLRPDQPELRAVNERRNIPLPLIGQLNHLDIDFVSLQKGEPAEGELRAMKDLIWPRGNLNRRSARHRRLRRYGRADRDFGPADQRRHLDGASRGCHGQAGLAAQPLRLMLALAGTSWRTARGYPTLRLFRQAAPGDWQGVMQRVEAALLATDQAPTT